MITMVLKVQLLVFEFINVLLVEKWQRHGSGLVATSIFGYPHTTRYSIFRGFHLLSS